MCSIVDSALDPALVEKKSVSLICKKCKENKSVVNLRVKDSYCADCFLASCTHKFRSTIGKHKVLKHGDRVLVGFSGGACSTALIHLLKSGFDDSTPKKVNYVPLILIIRESFIHDNIIDDENDRISKTAEKYGFPVHVVSLAEGLQLNDKSTSDDEEIHRLELKLINNLKNIEEHSAKSYFIQKLKKRVFIMMASKLSCTKIMIGDSATSLAITLLAGIATGRGLNLPNDVGFLDKRNFQVNEDIEEDIKIQFLRPLREFSRKEVALYNHLNKLTDELTIISSTTFGQKQNSLFSIEKLTESFVVALQEDFPATVPTIFRTGDKLNHDDAESNDEENPCLICYGRLDTSTEVHNSLQATQFSQLVSNRGVIDQETLNSMIENMNLSSEKISEEPIKEAGENCSNIASGCGEEKCEDGGGMCSTQKKKEISDDDIIVKELCYSCRIFYFKVRKDSLPEYIVNSAMKRHRRKIMKAEIENFLL